MMMENNKIPLREEIPNESKWNLSKLFKSEKDWDDTFLKVQSIPEQFSAFKGTLGKSSDNLLKVLNFYKESGILIERLFNYASLRLSEDEGNSESRARMGKMMMFYTKVQAQSSWLEPEILSIDSSLINSWLEKPEFSEYRVFLKKILRRKPHVLSTDEEKLLALSLDSLRTASDTFDILTNVDMDFGKIETDEGLKPLSLSTFSSFMRNKNRNIREKAYKQFYKKFDEYKNTIASLYAGSCKKDFYIAQARKFASCREAALFEDNMPESVYDNLVNTISKNLPALHRYYELRKRILKVDKLKHYDVYVPLVEDVESRHTWEEAVDIVYKALAPLGEEYASTLKNGLLNGWADRYENKGKRSGAFSSGCYTSDPYIHMNYKDDNISDVFTMIHEGGHSMHSYYSVRNNPYMQYDYTIFEAEVASTFNENLLFNYLLNNTKDKKMQNYLISTQIDEIIGTLFRQTMFAEFEYKAHDMLEKGEPLTVDSIRSLYKGLLVKYFGPILDFEENSDLECLRIPHFYNAFYVYKYSTGISASIALSKKVLSNEPGARENYFKFLSSGGSRFPLESLKLAGVDMTNPEVVQAACDEFSYLVELLKKNFEM
jgi:oligoendopeptidase F